MDRVSIVTTFYNAKDFILQAIHSVNAQETDESFEIEYVLVDDKSPDNSLEVVQSYIKKFVKNPKLWKIVTPDENLGCGGARRFGLRHTTGQYIMALDADDYYLHKDFVKRAYHTIVDEKADIVEYGMIYNQSNGKAVNSVSSTKHVFTNVHDIELAIFKHNLIKFNIWTKIYKRSIVESFDYSDARTFEDVRTIPVWCANASKIIVMPSIEINYRAATGSIIRDNWTKTRLGTIEAIAEHCERFKDDYEILKALYGRAMIDIETVMSNHSSNDEGFNEMSRLNTKMLSYLYPDTYKEITFHIEDEQKQ